MRTRLFVISGLAIATVFGTAAAASATPQGPGDIKNGPGPTTSTTQAPKGPDKLAPKPTTTTIPPKGPGDLADAPKGDGPKGPGDLADAPKGGGVEPGPDTTGNGSGSDNYVPPADTDTDDGNGAGSSVAGESVDVPAVQNGEAAANETAQDSNGVSPILIVAAAAVVGALLAFFATRLRRDDADVNHV